MRKLPDNFSLIISRTDSIGDVVLTLPMAGYIKQHFPKSRIIFLGRNYTRDVVALSEHVDEFLSWDELKNMSAAEQKSRLKADIFVHVFPVKEIASAAKKAGVPIRVGTTNRLYHWWTCNKLISLSRKNSPLHEAQLNLKLLSFLGVPTDVPLEKIPTYYGCTKARQAEPELLNLIDKNKFNVILHPKSKGSAREWGLDNFSNLIKALPADRYKIFISGTKEEGELIKDLIKNHPSVTDLTGKLSLSQFVSFINACDGLVAASTGPLHIAAAVGKKAIGLFAPMRPIHPGRWMALGKDAHYLVVDRSCEDCRVSQNCHCIREISVKQVVDLLEKR
jgi:ADP-heptose:LPS heptosyltransferase